jgi:hypothetical protein
MAKLQAASDRAGDIKVAQPWILPGGAIRRSTSSCGSCTLLPYYRNVSIHPRTPICHPRLVHDPDVRLHIYLINDLTFTPVFPTFFLFT